jgi:hypothetical protein
MAGKLSPHFLVVKHPHGLTAAGGAEFVLNLPLARRGA